MFALKLSADDRDDEQQADDWYLSEAAELHVLTWSLQPRKKVDRTSVYEPRGCLIHDRTTAWVDVWAVSQSVFVRGLARVCVCMSWTFWSFLVVISKLAELFPRHERFKATLFWKLFHKEGKSLQTVYWEWL